MSWVQHTTFPAAARVELRADRSGVRLTTGKIALENGPAVDIPDQAAGVAGVSRRNGSSDTELCAHRFPRGNHIHARLIEPLNPRVDWEPFVVTPRLQLFHSNQERLAQREFQELRGCS